MLHSSELMNLLEDFYTLTNIRIVVFDEECHEICSFPKYEDCLCSYLRKCSAFDSLCRESDRISMDKVKRCGGADIYRCHAGFVEVTVRIMKNQQIVGYLMLGQIVKDDGETFLKNIGSICEKYGMDLPDKRLMAVAEKTEKQILAAAKILEACAEYVITKDMFCGSKPFVGAIEQYISDNLSGNLDVASICRHFCISRTYLYRITSPYYSTGVSGYIKNLRLSRAKELLENGGLTVCEVCEAVGFSDYDYFLRCFKRKYRKSAKCFLKSK